MTADIFRTNVVTLRKIQHILGVHPDCGER